MNTEEVWFSHRENKWEVIDGKFSWTEKEDIWDFDNCTVGIARTLENELIGVVRSRTNANSIYMGAKPVELRWKWEYIPWLKDAPIIFGKKTREEINSEFKKWEL